MSNIADKISPQQRAIVAASVVLASTMMTLDSTIVNVALPTMQGALGATHDQISWVITSYVIACAIGTPLMGALATPFGMRRLYLLCILGFGGCSVLCGLSSSLPEMVTFRILQGLAGGAFFPLSQALLLDIYPKEDHTKATGLFTAGVMIGPMLGPTLGGFLTEIADWRWVFLINVPVAVVAFIGSATMPRTPRDKAWSFDFTGFALFSVAIAATQLMLDRGEVKDWFHSREIIAEGLIGALAAYLFVVHTITRPRTFIDKRIFQDRSFVIGVSTNFIYGSMLFITLVLMPPFLQGVQGRSVMDTGIILIPRAFGMVLSTVIAGQLIRLVGPRLLILAGILISALGLWVMAHTTVETTAFSIAMQNFFQALGVGLSFLPTTMIAFSTLTAELRPIAASVYNLARSASCAIGLSIAMAFFTRNMDGNMVRLSEQMTVFNPAFKTPAMAHFALSDPVAVALMSRETARQAMVIAFNNCMIGQMWVTLAIFLALLAVLSLWKPARTRMSGEDLAAAAEATV